MYMLMKDEEGRKKEASKVKQTTEQYMYLWFRMVCVIVDNDNIVDVNIAYIELRKGNIQ